MAAIVSLAAAILAGAGLASAAAAGIELGGEDLQFGRVDHVSSPPPEIGRRGLYLPYHSTESSEKYVKSALTLISSVVGPVSLTFT